jgi:hypothetical protein
MLDEIKDQSKELGSRGIAVNTVALGAIATDFGGQRIEVSGGALL